MVEYKIQTWADGDGNPRHKIIMRDDAGNVIGARGLNAERVNEKEYVAEVMNKMKIAEKTEATEIAVDIAAVDVIP